MGEMAWEEGPIGSLTRHIYIVRFGRIPFSAFAILELQLTIQAYIVSCVCYLEAATHDSGVYCFLRLLS